MTRWLFLLVVIVGGMAGAVPCLAQTPGFNNRVNGFSAHPAGVQDRMGGFGDGGDTRTRPRDNETDTPAPEPQPTNPRTGPQPLSR